MILINPIWILRSMKTKKVEFGEYTCIVDVKIE